jgi:hypothetical protein
MSDNDIRQQDIDIAAGLLVGATEAPAGDWDRFAAQTHGRTRAVYQRCGELARAAEEMRDL